jgi:hypothetical protein
MRKIYLDNLGGLLAACNLLRTEGLCGIHILNTTEHADDDAGYGG